ncbi:MAG: ATP-binding protein [Oscillospiraceae bacterium]|nr:ATP-binding protein [Oscillospiraceae bacterium]
MEGHMSYLNPSSALFRESLASEIYIDKSELLAKTNKALGTRQKAICLSRPRRFGKSMAADMLAAYYGRGEDTSALFDGLKISEDPSYREHLNQHDVIQINMQDFLSHHRNIDDMLSTLQLRVITELRFTYPCVEQDEAHLDLAMKSVFDATNTSFVIIIDEWDCIFREHKNDKASQDKYLDFLRTWLKDKVYVGLVYMTGILPIKKYGTHSALNMFDEYSMTNAGGYAEFFGFTEPEVRALCARYAMSFDEAKSWYDGYTFRQPGHAGGEALSMYNPNSVVRAMMWGEFDTYWNRTENYEALAVYMRLDKDGLRDDIIKMIAGDSVKISTGTFQNDMVAENLKHRDDVLTLLVHLGYLSYDSKEKLVRIPNNEVRQEYINAINGLEWHGVAHAVEASYALLKALWNRNEAAVAEGIDRAHENVSILQYNDENALGYTISLAFYTAIEYYTIFRELPTGKGYADVVYIPRKLHAEKPAVVIELKYNKSAEGAIEQIRAKRYPAALSEYHGNLLLCGINYDRESKTHQCRIERLEV